MLDTLRKVIYNCSTGKDNATYTPDRVYGAIGFIAILMIVFMHNPPFMEICQGLGLYLTTWCTSIFIKKGTEPEVKNDNS